MRFRRCTPPPATRCGLATPRRGLSTPVEDAPYYTRSDRQGGATSKSRPSGWSGEGRTHAETRRRGELGGGGFCTKGQKGNKRGGWRAGGGSTWKTMKTASRTWKEGGKWMFSRGAGGPPAGCLGGGRQAKRPMFSVISHPAARLEAAPPESMRCLFSTVRATSGGAASCRALADGGRTNGSRKVRHGRKGCGRWKGGMTGGTDAPSVWREDGECKDCHFALDAAARQRHSAPRRPGHRAPPQPNRNHKQNLN
jgi:hypothetical protein